MIPSSVARLKEMRRKNYLFRAERFLYRADRYVEMIFVVVSLPVLAILIWN